MLKMKAFHVFFLCLGSLIAGVSADERIDTLAELQHMQEQVKQVVRETTSATVGLVSPHSGASGSGVIVSKDGLILTAAHVIEGSPVVNVIFPDGETVRGKVLGYNRTKDQGMVQITDDGEWPYVQLGNSLEMTPGKWVVALGHPGGYDPVRTPPVRLGRVQSVNAVGFFTTDCKLIGGDSGGPLFDLNGKLVGIHSSIGGMKTTSINNHAGVADFQTDWDKLEQGQRWGEYGEIITPDGPVLGVIFDPRALQGGGVLIRDVARGGPSDKAGLKVGDVILVLDGEVIPDPMSFRLRIVQRRAGEKVGVTFRRGNQILERVVTLGRRKDVVVK